MSDFDCPVCHGTRRFTVDSYKHHWHTCGGCGSVVRERKQRYLLPRLLPEVIGRHIPFRDYLYPVREVIERESAFYDYYANVSAEAIAGSKWEHEAAGMARQLAERGISLDGKRVLDVSGGPGYFLKSLPGIASDSVVTEFSAVAVEGMKKNFGLQAVQYDLNSDVLSARVRGPFDVVFIRYAINYCFDLSRFVESLKDVMRPGAVVLVIFLPPSLGVCLRKQHDDYEINVLYRPETMNEAFRRAGFDLVAEARDGSPYFYLSKRPLLFDAFMLPFTAWYTLAALKSGQHVDRGLVIENRVGIYRYLGTE